ncbi:MAG: flagellin, partial [Thermaerobacter sp.]|nr:flagellin [Thermaerobacter sp.]
GTSSDSGSVSINASFTPVSVAGTSVATVAGFSVVAATNPLSFQVGPSDHSYNRVQTYLGQFNSVTLGLNNLTVVGSSTAQTGNAEYAINLAQNALSILTNAQGQIGAQQDQLTYTIQNLQTENTNLQAARSTIMDANMANVSSNFAREQILQQTGLQALAAANQMPGLVLKLLG